MCGVVGKYFFDKNIYFKDDLGSMLESIAHRGPDSEGSYNDGRVVLGFRRLSIIDTVSGDQPLVNEDGDIIVIANGEIYNYRDLKNILVKKNHKFKTGSDCEVLVHLYEEYGVDFVNRLNGMFAFCLYDKKNEKLLLGRDRVGIKPLYVSSQKGVVLFASEIKAILEASECTCTENTDVLEEYLCFRSLSGCRTFFSGVELLTPGTIVELSPQGMRKIPYWKPEIVKSGDVHADHEHLIRTTLNGSIVRQLMSDVPLGTQLSGGVDSGWVSCLASMEAPGMKSFTVGFPGSDFDETSAAKMVADQVGLEYHQINSESTAFAEDLTKIIWYNDEPLTHANSVEIFNLCRYAKGHVKVLLTGEGADELFGGYPRYYLSELGSIYRRLPSILRPAFRHGLDWLARGREKKPSVYVGMHPKDLVFWNAAFTLPDKVAWLMDQDRLKLMPRRELLDNTWNEELSPTNNLLLYELLTYLQPILLRQDKMSMGASIESRVPILDNEMIDLALSLPAAAKLKAFQTKYLFKKAAGKDLPVQIIQKSKVGFGVPVGAWMREGATLGASLDRVRDRSNLLPGINSQKLEKIIKEHSDGVCDHQDILWPLLNYAAWKEVFF